MTQGFNINMQSIKEWQTEKNGLNNRIVDLKT